MRCIAIPISCDVVSGTVDSDIVVWHAYLEHMLERVRRFSPLGYQMLASFPHHERDSDTPPSGSHNCAGYAFDTASSRLIRSDGGLEEGQRRVIEG